MPLSNRSPGKTTNKKQPKTDPAPFVSQPSESRRNTAHTQPTTTALTTRAVAPLLSLDGIEHGLNFPSFDSNAFFASDLFTVSSALPRTTKAEADAMVQAIEEQRQSLRVAQSNIELNRDVVKTGTLQQKLWGQVIDYATVGMVNRTKAIGYTTAGVNQATALVKLEQAQEQFDQEETVLLGMRSITPLIGEEWKQRKALKLSKIEDLKLAVMQASSKVANQIEAMGSDFQHDLQNL